MQTPRGCVTERTRGVHPAAGTQGPEQGWKRDPVGPPTPHPMSQQFPHPCRGRVHTMVLGLGVPRLPPQAAPVAVPPAPQSRALDRHLNSPPTATGTAHREEGSGEGAAPAPGLVQPSPAWSLPCTQKRAQLPLTPSPARCPCTSHLVSPAAEWGGPWEGWKLDPPASHPAVLGLQEAPSRLYQVWGHQKLGDPA